MITPKNLIRHELIGLNTEIVNSLNKNNLGISGVIVNETKNMFTIRTDEKDKNIQKAENVFVMTLPSNRKVKVDGSIINVRPEDRIKLRVKKW